MSFESAGDDATGGDERRAAHVKWDGKTIALGTFSAQEAAEKCDRAKTLTKKWRTTMIPKPDVEWVKSTLERLNIRVVNDRPGRRKKRNINEVESKTKSTSSSPPSQQNLLNLAQSRDQAVRNSHNSINLNNMNAEANYHAFGRDVNSSFSTSGRENTGLSMGEIFSNSSSHYGGNSQQRDLTNSVLSSLPTNVYNNVSKTRTANQNSLPTTNTIQIDDSTIMDQRSMTSQQQLASMVFGSSQHYKVLKEHHTNLLKELQETTTLMNMYHQNSTQQNIDSLSAARMRNRDSLDQLFDQSLFAGSNHMGSHQLYPQSTGGRDSLGLGGTFQGLGGMSQLGQYQGARRDSLRSIYPPQANNDDANKSDRKKDVPK